MTLYRFNRYVNGHNEAGFVTKQISFTSDQINKRNASIKRAYAQKQEIKEKISAAVTKRKLEDPTYTINLSNASAKRWSDPEYRSMMSDAQRKSWSLFCWPWCCSLLWQPL
jgi:hypothetical protein